jgi:hypothetical protein
MKSSSDESVRIEGLSNEELLVKVLEALNHVTCGNLSHLLDEMAQRDDNFWALFDESFGGTSGSDDLGLNDPQVMVEPDVKQKIKRYFVKMGLVQDDSKTMKRAQRGTVQDPSRKTMWRDVIKK